MHATPKNCCVLQIISMKYWHTFTVMFIWVFHFMPLYSTSLRLSHIVPFNPKHLSDSFSYFFSLQFFIPFLYSKNHIPPNFVIFAFEILLLLKKAIACIKFSLIRFLENHILLCEVLVAYWHLEWRATSHAFSVYHYLASKFLFVLVAGTAARSC